MGIIGMGFQSSHRVTSSLFLARDLHFYGEAAGLDTSIFTSYSLAWSTISGSVLILHRFRFDTPCTGLTSDPISFPVHSCSADSRDEIGNL